MSRWPQVTVALVLCACSERPVPEPIPDDVGQRWADVVCPAAMACDCETYASIEDCEAHILAEFERLEPKLRNFSESCFEEHLDSALFPGCLGGMEDFIPNCQVFSGAGEYGDPCELLGIFGGMSVGGTCRSELFCHPALGVCRDWDPPAPVKSVGDACDDQLSTRTCIDDQLYCHVDECRPVVPVGEPCTHPDACGWTDFYCQGFVSGQGQGVCAPQLPLGEPCDPKEIRPCGPRSQALEWCNPATARCEAPEPAVCRIE